ncbi:Cytochrome c [Flavobacterium nitrogenifigens]|uniref:Cytochrome c n=1 Tax=Flavobacterium nitrogenifigens TaxID=1617283 RepID=A0A521CZ76_9FLAO|nr:cytochrome c [Flavobacterium nitrogenifigens]SMO64759.1 Cytochrome c [Flavobacterium nitrogenifigens]
MKRIRQILSISLSLIILLIGIIFYQIKYNPSRPDLRPQIPVSFCGTQAFELTGDAYKGKEIFNSNCAACHKLDSESTGPALRNLDSLVFVKWMLRKNHKIDSTKIENLGIDYHRATFKDVLNEENLLDLIDYCSRVRY